MGERLKRGLWLAPVALLASGCDNRSDMEEAVAYDLIDPSSAQFREVRQTDDGTWCGQVNGKNRMGAYTGYNDFFALEIGSEYFVTIVNPNDEILGELHRKQFLEECDPERLEILNEVQAEADAIEAEAQRVHDEEMDKLVEEIREGYDQPVVEAPDI